jgi:hypothetical protein
MNPPGHWRAHAISGEPCRRTAGEQGPVRSGVNPRCRAAAGNPESGRTRPARHRRHGQNGIQTLPDIDVSAPAEVHTPARASWCPRHGTGSSSSMSVPAARLAAAPGAAPRADRGRPGPRGSRPGQPPGHRGKHQRDLCPPCGHAVPAARGERQRHILLPQPQILPDDLGAAHVLPVDGPPASQNRGMTAAMGRALISSSGVFCSRSLPLPPNGLTGRPLPAGCLPA